LGLGGLAKVHAQKEGFVIIKCARIPHGSASLWTQTQIRRQNDTDYTEPFGEEEEEEDERQ